MLPVPRFVCPRRKKRSITVEFVQETPGGYICGVDVKNFKANSSHRIVVRLATEGQYDKARTGAGRLGTSSVCVLGLFPWQQESREDSARGMFGRWVRG